MFLRNINIFLQGHTAVHSIRPSAWERYISYKIFTDIFTPYVHLYDTRVVLNWDVVHGTECVKMITNPFETDGMQELLFLLRSTCMMTLSSLITGYFPVVM